MDDHIIPADSASKTKRESEMFGASSGLSNAVRPSPAILWDLVPSSYFGYVRQRQVLDFLKQIGTKISVMISLQTQSFQVIYRSVTGDGSNIFYFLSVKAHLTNLVRQGNTTGVRLVRFIGGGWRTRKGSVGLL